uniref:Uncharacterized protein n=1 Tax=Hippocampus comes TaxID=109280 RepID=A0A3Q2YV01_HIPCM
MSNLHVLLRKGTGEPQMFHLGWYSSLKAPRSQTMVQMLMRVKYLSYFTGCLQMMGMHRKANSRPVSQFTS